MELSCLQRRPADRERQGARTGESGRRLGGEPSLVRRQSDERALSSMISRCCHPKSTID